MPTSLAVENSDPPLGSSFNRRCRLSRMSCLIPDDWRASAPIARRVSGRFSTAPVT
jgi:hypothetical protein